MERREGREMGARLFDSLGVVIKLLWTHGVVYFMFLEGRYVFMPPLFEAFGFLASKSVLFPMISFFFFLKLFCGP